MVMVMVVGVGGSSNDNAAEILAENVKIGATQALSRY